MVELEIWRALPAIECEVSNHGRVRNTRTGRIRKPSPHRHGYRQVVLRRNGRMRAFYVHRLVCEAFHGPAPEGFECDHINRQRDDNCAANLRWVLPRENKAHRHCATGAANGAAKLNPDEVNEIRGLFRSMTNTAISRRFSFSPRTIADIRTGVTWNG